MKTTADEHLAKVRTHIREAAKELSQVVIEECSGYNDYTVSYQILLSSVMQELIKLKTRLEP